MFEKSFADQAEGHSQHTYHTYNRRRPINGLQKKLIVLHSKTKSTEQIAPLDVVDPVALSTSQAEAQLVTATSKAAATSSPV